MATQIHSVYQPFNGAGLTTSNYGVMRGTNMHAGVDYAGVPMGTAIQAATSGTVVYSGYNTGGNGWVVVVQDAYGNGHVYSHMGNRLVNDEDTRPAGMPDVGDTVRAGDSVGTVGNTGSVSGQTGIHLHYAVIKSQHMAGVIAADDADNGSLGVNLNANTTINPTEYANSHSALYARDTNTVAQGYFRDTTQYDALGNVTIPGDLVWVPMLTVSAPSTATGTVSNTTVPTAGASAVNPHSSAMKRTERPVMPT
jgi:Peptidase family M23